MSNKGNKRRLSLICATILFALAITSFAHSGRTDANGGHWNHATGEYHYHTGENAGKSSSKSSTKNKYKSSAPTKKTTTQSTDKETTKKEESTFWEIALVLLIGFFPILVPVCDHIIEFVSDFIKSKRKRK